MTTFTYTKMIRIEHESLEERVAYEQFTTSYVDWYVSQQEEGLADPNTYFIPYRYVKNADGVECIFEILLADQDQVHAWQALVYPMSTLTGYPIRFNQVTDVSYTLDQIPSDFIVE